MLGPKYCIIFSVGGIEEKPVFCKDEGDVETQWLPMGAVAKVYDREGKLVAQKASTDSAITWLP